MSTGLNEYGTLSTDAVITQGFPQYNHNSTSVLNAFQNTPDFLAKWQPVYGNLATIDGAVAFAKDGIQLTARYAPLRNGVRTVGGRLDILVLEPDNEYEIQYEVLEL